MNFVPFWIFFLVLVMVILTDWNSSLSSYSFSTDDCCCYWNVVIETCFSFHQTTHDDYSFSRRNEIGIGYDYDLVILVSPFLNLIDDLIPIATDYYYDDFYHEKKHVDFLVSQSYCSLFYPCLSYPFYWIPWIEIEHDWWYDDWYSKLTLETEIDLDYCHSTNYSYSYCACGS